jgi:hypothetical protein
MDLITDSLECGYIVSKSNGEFLCLDDGVTTYDSNLIIKDKFNLPSSFSGHPFSKLVIGHDGSYYFYSEQDIRDSVAYLLKLNNSGDSLWINDSLKMRGQNLTFSGQSKLVQYENEVFVFELFGEADSSRYGVTHLNAQTGEVKSFEMLDIPYAYFYHGRAFYNEKWYFTAGPGPKGESEGMLIFDVDGSYEYAPLDFPAANIVATTHNGIFSVDADYYGGDWSSELYRLDYDAEQLNAYQLAPTSKYPGNDFSLGVFYGVFSEKYGIILRGRYRNNDSSSSNHKPWLAQLNPDNGNIVWDTVFDRNNGLNSPRIYSNGQEVFLKEDFRFFYELKFKELNFNTVLSDDEVEEEQAELKIYPNPTSSRFRVKSSKEIESISVYDLSGRLVIDEMVRSRSYRSKLTSLGMYLVKIITDDGNTSVKRLMIR